MKLGFLGGTGTVTGSKYLLESPAGRLLVDCGLFQGYKQLRLRNWRPPPVAPGSLDAVVLTHAHLDHSGYLPLLVRNGFAGEIHCTEATRDLCRIMLPDSGRLLEEEAEHANRHRWSKHSPALPLYTEQDALRALTRFVVHPYEQAFKLGRGFTVRLSPAGHILGAALVRVTNGGGTLLFSGDLGRPADPIMRAPAAGGEADYLVVESTYGDRRHDPTDPIARLGGIVRRTMERGGVVVVPTFTVGRAQTLLHALHLLKSRGELPAALPIYLNSPMATDVTAIYHRHRDQHRLDDAACIGMCRVAHLVNSVEESQALNARGGPMVIVAGSGMATGGRVVHHLKAFAPDPKNTILFTGFQAGGTRGAALLAGADHVRIHGSEVPVRAEVVAVDNLSAHADSGEILDWLRGFARPPRRTFITHGEPAAADALRQRIEHELGWDCAVPEHLETVELA